MTDAACFREADQVAVYGPTKSCFQTGRGGTADDPVDDHHILGRGELFGIHKDDPRRSMFSSMFNRAGLKRSIHVGPLRDCDDQRRVYLRVAAEKVMQAVGQLRYTLRPEDYGFVELLKAEGYDAPVLPLIA